MLLLLEMKYIYFIYNICSSSCFQFGRTLSENQVAVIWEYSAKFWWHDGCLGLQKWGSIINWWIFNMQCDIELWHELSPYMTHKVSPSCSHLLYTEGRMLSGQPNKLKCKNVFEVDLYIELYKTLQAFTHKVRTCLWLQGYLCVTVLGANQSNGWLRITPYVQTDHRFCVNTWSYSVVLLMCYCFCEFGWLL